MIGCHKPPLDGPEGQLGKGPYEIRTLVFYNVENLFDTQNDPLVDDDARTPDGTDQWTEERYTTKIQNIARVLSEIGKDNAKRTPDLIGLCEVENLGVLNDLLAQEALSASDYGIIHYDSPDLRGIDVALIYKKSCFIPIESSNIRLDLRDEQNRPKTTRDQLLVFGQLDGEPLYISVNHWPSRSGGQAQSDPLRRQAAALQRDILDSVLQLNPEARFISMGDFNDDPTDVSIKYVLGTLNKAINVPPYIFYNPMEKLFNAGLGTLAYRDQWNLFDQVLFNGNWFSSENQFEFWKAQIYMPDYLKTPSGTYKGYPFRSYSGGTYLGGYSDHFPVYAYLIRKVKPDS
jgi:hypothetical protein